MILRRTAIFALLALSALSLFAQTAVPTPEEYLSQHGLRFGRDFTPHHHILGYFDELAGRSPLVSVQKMGETYEKRPLVLATITSAKNRAALDDIRRNIDALGRGSADSARAAEIARNGPAVVWLGFGVHGNESSSAEAAMLIASTLLRDADSAKLLDDLVIVIDPLQNPDGRERYISWFRRARGEEPSKNPDAFEHNEPWPGGRFNHYLIDMNRDWAWLSQRETQARVAAFRQWHPQVFVDFHEMGYTSSYFFPPDAAPLNANLPADAEKWLETFGRANAEEFSKRHWQFFVAERFDLFYPAYGDSWPSLQGAIGMTYEVAGHSRAGVVIEREDGTLLTLRDRIDRHFTTGMATLRTASQNREPLLRYTYDAARKAVDSGKDVFLLLAGSPNFETLVELLQKQGIEVNQLAAPVTLRAARLDGDAAESRSFPAGTAVVSTRQPRGALAQTLLEKNPVLDKSFVEEQRSKALADESDDFYDLTTWSLPLAMNVEGFVAPAPFAGSVKAFEKAAPASFRNAAYGYVVDGNDPNIYRFAGKLLASEVKFSVSDGELSVADRRFARGTIIVLKANNNAQLDATLQRLAEEARVSIAPVASGWTGGAGFGSERIRFVKNPKIALVGGPGVSPTSYGMLWHTLDVDTPIPHTTLTLESFRGVNLSKYEVLVLPDGSYAEPLGKRGIDKLKAWVTNGGTLVAVKGASSFLREKDVEISKLKPWEAPKKKDDDKSTDARYNDFRVPGSAFRTTMNSRSFLTFGVPRSPAVLVEGSSAYLPLTHSVDNIISIDAKNPLISGVAWPESLERLKGSAYVTSEPYGRGQVITFADDPHFRLFWRSTLPVFLNAVVYGPSFPR
jgi:hypothetical protein